MSRPSRNSSDSQSLLSVVCPTTNDYPTAINTGHETPIDRINYASLRCASQRMLMVSGGSVGLPSVCASLAHRSSLRRAAIQLDGVMV